MFEFSDLMEYISKKIVGFEKEFMSNDLNRILSLIPKSNYEDLLSDINFHKGFLNLVDVREYAYKYSKSNLKDIVVKKSNDFIEKIRVIDNLNYQLALRDKLSTIEVFERWAKDKKELIFYMQNLEIVFTKDELSFMSKSKGLRDSCKLYQTHQNELRDMIYNYFWNLQMSNLLPISKSRVLEGKRFYLQ